MTVYLNFVFFLQMTVLWVRYIEYVYSYYSSPLQTITIIVIKQIFS